MFLSSDGNYINVTEDFGAEGSGIDVFIILNESNPEPTDAALIAIESTVEDIIRDFRDGKLYEDDIKTEVNGYLNNLSKMTGFECLEFGHQIIVINSKGGC